MKGLTVYIGVAWTEGDKSDAATSSAAPATRRKLAFIGNSLWRHGLLKNFQQAVFP